MRTTFPALLFALVAATQAGCATRQSMDSAYDRSLQPWQGATEEALRARWGTPASEEQTPGGKWLTYVVQNPATVTNGGPRIGIGIGGFGGGGHVSVGSGVGISLPVGGSTANSGQVASCTTRFLVEGGKVSSWTFDGAGCGAAE